MTDNDKRPGFWEETQTYMEKIGVFVGILGLIASIVAFLKVSYGPYVFFLVVLILVTGYALRKTRQPLIAIPAARHESWRSKLERLPWWGKSSLAAIPLLVIFWSGQLCYTQWKLHQSPTRFIILVADFYQIDAEIDPYAMTDKLIHNLRAALIDELEASVVPLRQRISKREPSDFTCNIGAERGAMITIWGAYTVTPTMVDLWAHFEVLEKPAQLPIEVEQAGKIGMEVQRNREQWESLELRDQVVNELTYLTMFTLGLVRYEAGDTEYAIAHFSKALTQVGGRSVQMVPLNQCEVYFYRGKAFYDWGDYDKAITDLDEALHLCPSYAAAYEGRGKVHAHKGDYNQAVTDWNKGSKLETKLPPVH